MKKILLLMVLFIFFVGCGSHSSEKSVSEETPTITADPHPNIADSAQENEGLSATDTHPIDDSFCQKGHCVFPHEKLSELILVGTMTGHHFQWAFLESASGTNQKIELGDWVGDAHEKVVGISRDFVELVNPRGQKSELEFKE